MSDPAVESASAAAQPQQSKPFWGTVNGKPLRIRTMAATGPFGSGKSLLGDMIDPRNTFKIDIEASSTATNLPFRRHAVLFDEIKSKGIVPTPLECFTWWRDQMESVKPGEYTVVNVDPINEIQQGAYDWVVANPSAFGRTSGQYEKMTALAWGDVKTLLEGLIGSLSKKIETFYYTLHMGQVWKQGKPVEGKMKAKGSDVFRKIADVVFVLNRPIDPKTGKVPDKPVGICVGDIGKSRLVHANPDTGEVLPILPPQIVGIDANKIRAYIAKPPDYKKLKKDELVTIEVMTEDEKLQLQAQIAADQREAEEIRSARSAGAAAAAERNRQALAASGVIEQKSAPAADGRVNSDCPSASEATAGAAEEDATGNAAEQHGVPSDTGCTGDENVFAYLPHSRKVFIVREQFSELEQKAGLTRDQMVAAIEKRGGAGKKLADLTDEQLVELRNALWSKLTAIEVQARPSAFKPKN